MISDERIAQTIMKLMRSGKKMPQDMALGRNTEQEAVRILQETVAQWKELFGKTGAERWNAAERIALTLYGVPGLNVNIITPALMQAALKQATDVYVQQNVEENDAMKKQPVSIQSSEDSRTLWEWTRRKLALGISFAEYSPDDETIINYGRKIGLADTEIMKQKSILKAYLCDAKFAAVNKCPIGSKLFVHQAGNGKMVKLALI